MSTATLTWTNPTTRTDGSPLAPTDIAFVTVTDADTDPTVAPVITKIMGQPTTFTTGVLPVGTHDFSLTVTDTGGHTSAASNVAEVVVPVTQANPSAVTNLAAVLNP